MKNNEIGRTGEALARQELEKQGFKILATNYRCRYGELDIVARDQDSLVFVEVKTRSNHVGFEQAIGPKKVRNLHYSARCFMQNEGESGKDYRFLVIFVALGDRNDATPYIECIENPF